MMTLKLVGNKSLKIYMLCANWYLKLKIPISAYYNQVIMQEFAIKSTQQAMMNFINKK